MANHQMEVDEKGRIKNLGKDNGGQRKVGTKLAVSTSPLQPLLKCVLLQCPSSIA